MFEYCINTRLNDDFARFGDDDISKLSNNVLEAQIELGKKFLRETSIPNDPDYNHYHSLQDWAMKLEEYKQCDHVEDQIEELQRQLEINNRTFNPETHVLYIYAGSVECLTKHSSSVESITASINGIHGETIKLNITIVPNAKSII